MADEVDQTSWFEGLAHEWDSDPMIRDRILRGDHLLLPDPKLPSRAASKGNDNDKDAKDPMRSGYVEKIMANLRFNCEVLEPALRRWSENDRDAVPQVDCLASEVEKLMQICHRPNPGAAYVHMDAWALRRLMTLLKSLTTKPKIPKASYLQSMSCVTTYALSHAVTLRFRLHKDLIVKRLLLAFGFGEEVGHAECSFQYMFGVPKLHVHMHGFQDIGEKEEEEEKPPSRPVATPARARATAKAKSSPASSKKGSPASMEASPSVASTPASCKKGSPASTVASPALVRPSSNDSPVPNAPAESPGSVKPSSTPNLMYRDRKSTSFLSDLTAADDSEVAPGESRESRKWKAWPCKHRNLSAQTLCYDGACAGFFPKLRLEKYTSITAKTKACPEHSWVKGIGFSKLSFAWC